MYAWDQGTDRAKGFDATYSEGYEDGIASDMNAAGGIGYQLSK